MLSSIIKEQLTLLLEKILPIQEELCDAIEEVQAEAISAQRMISILTAVEDFQKNLNLFTEINSWKNIIT